MKATEPIYGLTLRFVRKNQIRYVNDPTAPTTNIYGVDANSATNAIVENNVINNTVNDATTGRAVKYANCGTAKFFNNEDATGALLRGFNGTAFKSELQDAVEDVVLSF